MRHKALVLEEVTIVLQGHVLLSEWYYLAMAKVPITILCQRSNLVQPRIINISCSVNTSFTTQQGKAS